MLKIDGTNSVKPCRINKRAKKRTQNELIFACKKGQTNSKSGQEKHLLCSNNLEFPTRKAPDSGRLPRGYTRFYPTSPDIEVARLDIQGVGAVECTLDSLSTTPRPSSVMRGVNFMVGSKRESIAQRTVEAALRRHLVRRLAGAGVIRYGTPTDALVIPAKAGIQSLDGAFPKACGVDSRLRGNDRYLERPRRPNDTTTG